MKKRIIMATMAMMLVMTVGCGKAAQSTVNAANNESTQSVSDTALNTSESVDFSDGAYCLINDVKVYPGMDFNQVEDSLGKPEEKETIGDGDSGCGVYYLYNSIEISTSVSDEKNEVVSIRPKDKNGILPGGIHYGCTMDEVKSAYGEPDSSSDTGFWYDCGETNIQMTFNDGELVNVWMMTN